MLKKIKKILAASENRQTFFARVERRYSRYSKEYKFIERAYDDAKDAFKYKKRDGGERYFEHVRAVAIILIDYLFIFQLTNLQIPAYKIVAAALLHDVVEDCSEWTLVRIEREYGRDVAWLLDYVSKRPKSDFGGDEVAQLEYYHIRFISAPFEFFLIKLADRLHNQLTLWSCDAEKIYRKHTETVKIYLPLARKWGILVHELEATTTGFKKRMKKHMKQCSITT
ncbi:MAG: HD domain-containing protein [Patescibacteria group bacterium]|nr:HD domain-containing protein [Patescibacteria group bacterium]